MISGKSLEHNSRLRNIEMIGQFLKLTAGGFVEPDIDLDALGSLI